MVPLLIVSIVAELFRNVPLISFGKVSLGHLLHKPLYLGLLFAPCRLHLLLGLRLDIGNLLLHVLLNLFLEALELFIN